MNTDETEIRQLLGEWTSVTRGGPQYDVRKNHSHKALVYDVLPPQMYESVAAQTLWQELNY